MLKRFYYKVMLLSLLPAFALAEDDSGAAIILEEVVRIMKAVLTIFVSIFYLLPVFGLFGVITYAGLSFQKAYKEAKENREENAVQAGAKAGFISFLVAAMVYTVAIMLLDRALDGVYIETFMDQLKVIYENVLRPEDRD